MVFFSSYINKLQLFLLFLSLFFLMAYIFIIIKTICYIKKKLHLNDKIKKKETFN